MSSRTAIAPVIELAKTPSCIVVVGSGKKQILKNLKIKEID